MRAPLVGAVSETFGPAAGFNLPIVFLSVLLIFSFFIKDVPDDQGRPPIHKGPFQRLWNVSPPKASNFLKQIGQKSCFLKR
ncbi:hypothetical protein [Fictibacillus terranigra]|uniref:Uncharacterized protein n=1 Tax=Fictibacillus terranigra TaxID=3058424 RepID=A0ABT8E0T7_9BACL|nr:hypothetical protein [Fictibacillus sp. CENA-BCM004]MDN4071515.1 hypothetical protein [Fictibacillus sp. CENA-BCM004]